MRRLYELEILAIATIEIDDQVFERCNDDTMPYGAMDEDEMFDHLSYNAIANHARLSQLDGFADLSDDLMTVLDVHWELTDFERRR